MIGRKTLELGKRADCKSGSGRVVLRLVAIVVVLLLLLAAQFVLPIGARAQEVAQQGTVTVTASEGNAGVTYDAYCLFVADVDTEGEAKNLSWANPQIQQAVEDLIYQVEPSYAGTTPYDVASFIAEQLAGADETTVLGEGSFGALLAATLKGLSIAGTVTPGSAASFDEGYYLLVSTSSSLTGAKMGTAPIFVVVNHDEPVTISEKASLPTLTKQVLDDEPDSTWGSVADAEQGKDLDYRLIGTLPDNYATFGLYRYCFTDTLPEGMELATTQDGALVVTVTIGETDVTSQLEGGKGSISYEDGVLVVNIANLNALGLSVDKDTQVMVEYQAHLTDDAVVGMPGNVNSATLTYSNNPTDMGEGTSEPSTTTTYAYALKVVKQDSEEGDGGVHELLAGATFTLQHLVEEETYLYLQEDGTWAEDEQTAERLVTGDDGSFTLPLLPEGTYRLVETAAPKGYAPLISSVDLTITGDPTSNPQTLELGLVGVTEDMATGEADWESGTVTVTVNNQAGVMLPATGGSGVAAFHVTGLAMIVAATAIAVVTRVHASRRDQAPWC